MQLFNLVKANIKAEEPPWYMKGDDNTKGITAQQIIAYYFNWHTDQTQATEEEIEKWYLEKRGWTYEVING